MQPCYFAFLLPHNLQINLKAESFMFSVAWWVKLQRLLGILSFKWSLIECSNGYILLVPIIDLCLMLLIIHTNIFMSSMRCPVELPSRVLSWTKEVVGNSSKLRPSLSDLWQFPDSNESVRNFISTYSQSTYTNSSLLHSHKNLSFSKYYNSIPTKYFLHRFTKINLAFTCAAAFLKNHESFSIDNHHLLRQASGLKVKVDSDA